ncbi:DUF4232 domain-containing protein [Actinomycetospora sp. CA-053990]|uniref:DUF4232 domain-containing protein n=1 Tax=Actinomycetospora sp. CA-053990 TaxID=3239891 RepID=UPI003D8EDB01
MWEPLGPLAPSVYWRRRIAALGVVLAVLGGFVWAVAGLGGGEPDSATVEARARAAAMASAPTPEPAAPAAPAESGIPGPIEAALPAVVPPGGAPGLVAPPSPDGALFAPPGGDGFRGFLPPGVPTGSAGPLLSTPTSTPAPVVPPSTTPPVTSAPTTEAAPAEPLQERAPAPGPCADGDLKVTARTDAPRYAAGTKPVLSLVVTNTGSAPCVRDLDAAKQAVAVVVRPGEGLWGSNDCSPGDTDDVRTLAPGEEAVFSVRWSGKTSTPGCAGARTVVPPGDYQLLARLDGIVSEPARFTLAG